MPGNRNPVRCHPLLLYCGSKLEMPSENDAGPVTSTTSNFCGKRLWLLGPSLSMFPLSRAKLAFPQVPGLRAYLIGGASPVGSSQRQRQQQNGRWLVRETWNCLVVKKQTKKPPGIYLYVLPHGVLKLSNIDLVGMGKKKVAMP